MLINRYSKWTIVFLLASCFGVFTFISGCDDSGIIPEETVKLDTNVIFYYDLEVHEFWNDNSWSGVDLLLGRVVKDSSRMKDARLTDLNGDTTNFYLRSGHLSIDAPGYQARFNRIYAHQERFDTITMINVGNRPINPDIDFTSDDTYGNAAWGYFREGDTLKPVFSFYLKGKYLSVTPQRVYGVMLVKQIRRIPGDFYIMLDLRINKNGENKFTKAMN